MVQFLQIILHHSKAASAAILIRLATGNIDEVLIQESLIVGNNTCGLSTPLNKVFYTKGKGKTRTCILIPQFSEGNLTTVITRNMREVLDSTLISDPLLNQLEAWKVGIEHSFSDHRYIEFTITLDCPPAENIINLRLTNWGYYKNLLNRNLHAPPTHIRTYAKHKPPWGNATLANLKRECGTYFNRAKYSKSGSPGIYTI